ncbi:aliphatic sulfonate ABC transporter substrate-binding protein [Oharaeibacter diazotrophicus]|uniref:Putative aliphatic sulfonates-binding protein n=1 Tax=Oharaeibacter diazotrophicus TaxID=1920512 RepID=A0A4R6RG85_9HYPH|nr:aliphatic sulfonate ABC transporter substrate-binding protein [Oharaeibacter diazotrophicus]TDP85272.1 sulfonate transport system substrate-binding protein [Oharaeibacter diazotrophicus]BBE74243.1 putative aliphatic sulfonates-binding protein precursor [Pleomorphomonas sp. SM30]GLS76068.1 sulfonate ABC transporter substrate-binding protein [Oharaeibacter diazotrophicus]
MFRRHFLKAAAALAAATLALPAVAAEGLTTFNVGYQKIGVLVVARQQGLIEKALADKGIAVNWVEFQAGPPLLEALNAGAIDFGYTGDSPPVFSQAAGGNLVYVGAIPASGRGSAILVPKDSPIRSLADLKGRTVGFTKGSSAHNVIVAALEKAGLTYADITPAYLTPADAAAAFASGAIDAWSIWDPFYAVAEKAQGARLLADGKEILGITNGFFLANRTFAAEHSEELKSALAAVTAAGEWADANHDAVAAALSEVTKVPVDIQKAAADRTEFTVTPLTDEIVASQQAVADRFAELGLIPKPIVVKDIVWTPPQS